MAGFYLRVKNLTWQWATDLILTIGQTQETLTCKPIPIMVEPYPISMPSFSSWLWLMVDFDACSPGNIHSTLHLSSSRLAVLCPSSIICSDKKTALRKLATMPDYMAIPCAQPFSSLTGHQENDGSVSTAQQSSKVEEQQCHYSPALSGKRAAKRGCGFDSWLCFE